MIPKIFVVDQSKLIVSQLMHKLGDSFEVQSCPHADLALLKIIDWLPDLLITSVEIGNITGYDLCHILKMMPEFASVPVILISSHDQKKVSSRAAEVGADSYVEKNKDVVKNLAKKIIELLPKNIEEQVENKKQIESILLVDDSLLVRKMIANMFKSIGIPTIIQAENGKEALESLGTVDIDLVMSDYNMPVMNGPELLQELRKNEKYNEIPFVLASGEENEDQINEALNNGANGVLTKPISAKDLRNLLSELQK